MRADPLEACAGFLPFLPHRLPVWRNLNLKPTYRGKWVYRLTSRSQRSRQPDMKRMNGSLAADAVTPGVERPTAETALHLLADADVLELDLVRDGDALLDLLLLLRVVVRLEEEFEDNPAAIRAEREDEVGVHVALV